jgi:hypothetical protein
VNDQYGLEELFSLVLVALGSKASLIALVSVVPKLEAVAELHVREEGAGGLTLGGGEAARVCTAMAIIWMAIAKTKNN